MMIVDTNVVSELTKPAPNVNVKAWLSMLDDAPATTVITVEELRYGVGRLPEGRRRDFWERANDTALELMASVLPFDMRSAVHTADVRVRRAAIGRPISYPDAQIAGICRRYRAVLVTRNVRDFEGTGVEVMNPWELA